VVAACSRYSVVITILWVKIVYFMVKAAKAALKLSDRNIPENQAEYQYFIL
jgi:hypothetical protein